MNGEYVTIYEEYKQKFLQVPTVLVTGQRYKQLSNNSKLAWAILRERSSLSRKNKWFDKDTGRVYFIFTNTELMELMNIKSRTTLANIKKELEDANLIEQKRLGLSKPNKIYLKYPILDDEDIEKIDEFEKNCVENINTTENNGNAVTLGNQRSPFSGRPETGLQEVHKMDPSNTDYNNTEYKRLDTTDTETADFSSSAFFNSLTEQEREKERQKYMENAFYANKDHVPERIAHMLRVFSTTSEQANEYYKIILQAKKSVEDKIGQAILLEDHRDLEQGIINSFSRAVRKIEKDRNIENESGYIYQSIFGYLSNEIHNRMRKSAATNDDNSNVVFYDWLEK